MEVKCDECREEFGTIKCFKTLAFAGLRRRASLLLCGCCYRRHNKEIDRRVDLKRRYGISIDQYESLLDIQDNCCKICGKSHSENKKLVVDHCHETGTVRGLLCNKCNIAVGLLENNPDYAIKASQYLDSFRQTPAVLKSVSH